MATNQVDKIIDNVEKVIVGKRGVIELALAAMLAEGHILFEDVPGVGKTILVRSLARSIDCSFRRIQFTPDLLPSDVTGISIYNQKTNDFEFRAGPILSQIVLADEINRAAPRTQSSLLESMAERQVTIDGRVRKLPQPFIVMATQNPVEYDGTFPLPEAQLDRFLVKLSIGYPDAEGEKEILTRLQREHPVEALEAVIRAEDFVQLQRGVRELYLDEKIKDFIVNIISNSRKHPDLELGVSPRGSIALMKLGQALAFLRGRDYVLPDDIKEISPAVLGHRLIIKTESRLRGRTAERIVEELLRQTEVPVV